MSARDQIKTEKSQSLREELDIQASCSESSCCCVVPCRLAVHVLLSGCAQSKDADMRRHLQVLSYKYADYRIRFQTVCSVFRLMCAEFSRSSGPGFANSVVPGSVST